MEFPKITKQVDMSSAAIDRRLRELAQIYRLGMSLQKARRIGKVNDLRAKSETLDSSSLLQKPEQENKPQIFTDQH